MRVGGEGRLGAWEERGEEEKEEENEEQEEEELSGAEQDKDSCRSRWPNLGALQRVIGPTLQTSS